MSNHDRNGEILHTGDIVTVARHGGLALRGRVLYTSPLRIGVLERQYKRANAVYSLLLDVSNQDIERIQA